MKKLLLLLLCPFVCAAPQKDSHVVMISLDGFPAWLFKDESLMIPNLRKLAADGAVAKAMTVSNPSITWINHTTLVTGVHPRRHGVLYNGLLVRQGADQPPKIEQWVDKTRLVFAPTLYDIAHEAGLTSAESDWVAVTNAKTISWSFPEIPKVGGPMERELVDCGVLEARHLDWMQLNGQRKSVTFLDTMWTRAASRMFAQHRPNLLLYHTLNTDAVHHTYGPGSMASATALAYADRLVGDLLQSIEASGLRDKTTVIVTSDHGFKKVTKISLPNVVLKKEGLVRAQGGKVLSCDAYAMTQGGIAFVYVTDPARRAELLPKLKLRFAQTEGVDRVLDGDEAPTLGMPTPAENQGMGDLILYAKNGYAFRNDVGGDLVATPAVNYAGTHGYLSSDPELDAIFIISGRGIKKGVVMERMDNVDVAPTVARLLGITLPNPDGRVLEEVLAK
jgi:predicted AlkP superfamily pyrophosphatase or phosphodiesterase